MHRQLTALALAATAALGTAAAARAGEPEDKQVKRMVIVHGAPGAHAAHAGLPADPAQIPGDHLKVEDLATYAPGESRTYTTEGGATVTFTRADEGERYTLRAGDKEIEIGGNPQELALAAAAGNGEGKRIVIRHEVKSKDGTEEVEEERTIGGPGGPDVDLMLGGDGPPPLVVEIVGEKDGKATRQVIVLKTVEKVEAD